MSGYAVGAAGGGGGSGAFTWKGIWWVRLTLLLGMVGAVTSYFPGLQPDTLLTVMCQEAQTYSVGGTPGDHGVDDAKSSPPSLSINPSTHEYIPGHNIKVSITSGKPFIGVILQARMMLSTTSYGKFDLPNKPGALKNCDSTNDTVFLWLDTEKSNVTLTWIPPTRDTGTLQFYATVFERDGTFWSNITSPRLTHGFAAIDVDTCGKKKGCFRYSLDGQPCTEDTCEYLMTYVVEGSVAHFEMMANDGWVAVGFSSDELMGGDDVLMCVKLREGPEIRHYWNDYAHNNPTYLKESNPLYNHQTTVGDDGRIKCRFSRPLKVNNDQSNVDLYNDWYQLYAWGRVADSGTSIMRHTKPSPPVSSKMTLFEKKDVISSATSINFSICLILAVLHIHLT